MARKRKTLKIRVEVDPIKEAKRASRRLIGRAGQGRKTRHIDRKKEAGRKACRGGPEEDPT